eukprot:CAMPEP_0177424038 /NCGR_PEP_ID=MMETSP0368-20130122/72223_1 /TAXON_ID=447022 ORGANISM="Scrippsiella hangoei-like, Strain SHHI-4" /NCGR_SAMPLE_ID=MMETSP0368 /ASSEMBLY_ACC=CAM_ASM_000363 /LENGTH=219 /DNA_ID=CAMNT_0018894165 /DNA_START=73 /DNA_END=728 /DNA_ORIENTATION=+
MKHQDSDSTDVSGDEQASPGVDARGIPLKSDYPEGLPVPALYAIFTTVFTAICLGIAFAIYKFGSTEKYDKKIEVLTAYDLGWVYLVMFAVKLGMFGININLGVARKAAKVNVPDQHVYKVHTPGDASPLGFVLMESEGDLGRFNRAQRAYMNYLESAPLFFVYVLLAGFVFPFQDCRGCWLHSRAEGKNGRQHVGQFGQWRAGGHGDHRWHESRHGIG